MYYLQSRYYSPALGRFINADALVSTGQGILGNNMFAYCRNNPVRRKDIPGTTDVECFDPNGNILTDEEKTFEGGHMGNSGFGGSSNLAPGKQVSGSFRTGNNGQQTNPNQPTPSNTNSNGWKVGQDISKPTSTGNNPSWTTVRQRYWKNEAHYHSEQYSDNDLLRMRRGLAPKGGDGFSIELHHPYGRSGNNFYYFQKVTHLEHMEIHYGR